MDSPRAAARAAGALDPPLIKSVFPRRRCYMSGASTVDSAAAVATVASQTNVRTTGSIREPTLEANMVHVRLVGRVWLISHD